MAEQRVSVRSTDVLVVTAAEPMDVSAAQTLIERTGVACVVVLGPGESLRAVDEAEMSRHGWVRK